MKKSLPITPEKKAAIVTDLMNSPRTKKILEESGLLLLQEQKSNFKLFDAMVKDATSLSESEKQSGTTTPGRL